MFRGLQLFAIPAVLSCLLTACSSTPSSPQNSSGGSTRIALVDERDPYATVLTTMPGTYSDVVSLVMGLLKSPERGAGGRGRHYFKTPFNARGREISTIQPLHNYFKGARMVDGGAGVVLSFSRPALQFIDQPASGAVAMAVSPLAKTIELNYPNIKNFYYEFDGRIWTEDDWNY